MIKYDTIYIVFIEAVSLRAWNDFRAISIVFIYIYIHVSFHCILVLALWRCC